MAASRAPSWPYDPGSMIRSRTLSLLMTPRRFTFFCANDEEEVDVEDEEDEEDVEDEEAVAEEDEDEEEEAEEEDG